MTAKELRKAAEWFQSDDARGYSASVILKRDACGDVMSNYILATVQEDGEEEVTVDWIINEWGWTCVPEPGYTSFYRDSCRLESIGQSNQWRLYLLDYKVDRVISTRSQFRSLMAGLGIASSRQDAYNGDHASTTS